MRVLVLLLSVMAYLPLCAEQEVIAFYGDSRWDQSYRDLSALAGAKVSALHRNIRDTLLALKSLRGLSKVVHLGDAVYSGDDGLQWSYLGQEFFSKFEAAGLPVLLVLGNHEHERRLWDLIPLPLSSKRIGQLLLQHLGPTFGDHFQEHRVFTQRWLTFILADSQLPGSELVKFLTDLHAKHPGKKVLLLHRPLLAGSEDHTSFLEGLRYESLRWLMPLLSQWQVEAVIAAHDHVYSLLSIPTWPHQIGLPSAGAPLGTPRSENDVMAELRWNHHALDLPKQVQGGRFRSKAAFGFLLMEQDDQAAVFTPYLSDSGQVFQPDQTMSVAIVR